MAAAELSDDEMNQRLLRFVEASSARLWRIDDGTINAPERVFVAVWELEGEVNSGGLLHYFLNSDTIPYIVDALGAVGAPAAADITRRAISTVGPDVPWADDAARGQVLAEVSQEIQEKLEELDQAFLAYPDNLCALLYRYVCDHREELGAPPEF